MHTFDLKRPATKWVVFAALLLLVLTAASWLFSGVLSRIARERAIQGIKEKFASDLELKEMTVQVFPALHVTGEGLLLYYKGRRDLPPLISIRKFTANAGIVPLLFGHIRQVRLEGLEIQVPPKSHKKSDKDKREHKPESSRIAGFVIDEIIADGTVLRTIPRNPRKDPLVWEIRRLTLHDAGPHSPMDFRATLVNAKPPGDIESTGKFGPWQKDEPGDTPVEGKYSFRNADLGDFKGISGILSSEGTYRGILERLDVEGYTDVPNFTVNVSGNPVHLKTQFQAVVDGTNGDTLLQPVRGQFGKTSLVAKGGVEGTKGIKGKTVSLDVIVEAGRLEDILRLGVKGANPTMTGTISFQAKLIIPPGKVDIAKKMKLDGNFQIGSAHFSKLSIQEKVNKLSHSGKGEPEAPPDDTVASDFGGQFTLDSGVITLRNLTFRIPGVAIALNGHYGLLDEQMEFHGTATLEAKLSQTTTGFKSVLLKMVDPFFQKKKAGAVIPIKITGTRDKPTFGLDLSPGHK